MELKLFWSAALGEHKIESRTAFSANTRWESVNGHFSHLIQKLLQTHTSIAELIFASGVMPLDNEQANHC